MQPENKTNTKENRTTMTTFDQIKNDPRSGTEKLSSFKQECDENGTLFGVLAVGEFVTVTPGSVSNDSAFAIKVNDHPYDYIAPYMLWGTQLVRRVYNNGYGRTPWECHGQDIDNPHIDTDEYVAEVGENNVTLYQVIEDATMSRTLAQLIRFGGYIDIYDHDSFASWTSTVTNRDFHECIRWSPRQDIEADFMQDACTRIIVRDPRETEHGPRGEYGKNWERISIAR